MSWELISTYKKKCLCGKGTVTVERYMDDWNRTKEDSCLECDDCERKQIEEHNKQKEIRNACDILISYFNEKYLKQWIAYFDDNNTKKSIWETAYNMKLENCSLNSFYSRHRSLPMLKMDEYYKSLVQIQNIPQLIQVLKIKDEIIDNALPDLLDFYEEERRKRYNEAYAYYRKK